MPVFEEEGAEWPAILDDASVLRVDKFNNQLLAQNKNGSIQNYYPVNAPEGVQFIGTPLYTDLIESGTEYASLVVGQDSLSINIYAYSNNGELIEGFPLYVGKAISAQAQPIHPIIYDGSLYTIGHSGTLKSWNLTQVTDTKWGSRYGTAPFNKVSARVESIFEGTPSAFGVLNEEETYNWPNPAVDHTNIRFQISEPGGTVQVSIITVSGRIIFDETVSSTGGFPQEIRVETADWGSGGYIARIKATVGGKTETKLIKIGVVH